jgi:hypothetical protein
MIYTRLYNNTMCRRPWWNTAASAVLLGVLAAFTAHAAAPDHTTYIVRTNTIDNATLAEIQGVGGVIDHFDGSGIRAYVLHEHWQAFKELRIPHVVESVQPAPDKQIASYPSHAELGTFLTDIANDNPGICQLISIGRSVQGRELWALLISDQPGEEEDEPEFVFISTMHGDETVGTVLCQNFIETLVDGHGQNAEITELVDNTEIWILPLLNPDGYEIGLRWNANNADLNRSFPQWPIDYEDTVATDGAPDTTGRQTEVAHVMNWTAERSFTLAANLHTGALLVNYLYDEIPGIPSGQDAPTLDDDLMRHISTEYAIRNPPMFASSVFPGGISNGSAWFRASGVLQDWQYRYAGVTHTTIELSNIKNPNESSLPGLWDDNGDAMMAYLDLVHIGARGVVSDGVTGAPLFASITVGDNPQPVFTDPDVGDYHRLLLPGSYTIHADAPGYIPYTVAGVTVTEGDAVQVDIALSKGDVNGDGTVDALDLQLLINTILGRSTVAEADVDGNGVSATDLQHLVNRILGR